VIDSGGECKDLLNMEEGFKNIFFAGRIVNPE
jgi:hypothetical protein